MLGCREGGVRDDDVGGWEARGDNLLKDAEPEDGEVRHHCGDKYWRRLVRTYRLSLLELGVVFRV